MIFKNLRKIDSYISIFKKGKQTNERNGECKMKKVIYSLLAFVVIFTLAACSGEEEKTGDDKEEDRTIPVEVQEVTKKDLTVKNTVYGRTQPKSSAPIVLEMPGEIDSIEREEGEEVKKNDKLFVVKTPAGNQTIRASKDGRFINFSASEGEMVPAEEPVAYIADVDTLKVHFSVTGQYQALFKKDDTLDVYYDDEKGKLSITSIGTVPDDTGLYPVEGTIENEEDEILAGEVVKAIVPMKRVKDAIQVPTSAIVEEGGETFVYIAKDDKAKKVTVDIEETQSNQTAIKGKIKKGDQVIVNGQLTLMDGSKINVVEESGE